METSKINTRKLTVCRSARGSCIHTTLPEIRLRGKWLKDSGFESGQIITITCRNKELIIATDGKRKYEK